MNVGDLVTHVHCEMTRQESDFWDEPAIVVRGPYEKSHVTEWHGSRMTQLFVAIDIMHRGVLLTGVKKDNFIKFQKPTYISATDE